jgi:hypothetical protein
MTDRTEDPSLLPPTDRETLLRILDTYDSYQEAADALLAAGFVRLQQPAVEEMLEALGAVGIYTPEGEGDVWISVRVPSSEEFRFPTSSTPEKER